MGRKLLKTMQTITTFRNRLADPAGTRRGPLWSADPSLKTAGPIVVYRYLPWVLLSLLLVILYKRTIIVVNYDFYDDLLKPMRNSRNVLNSEMPGFSSRNPGIKNATAIPGFGISGLQSRLNIFHSIYFARRSVTPRRYGLSLPLL